MLMTTRMLKVMYLADFLLKMVEKAYHKEKDATDVPIRPEDIDIIEYKKMLYATLKDALEIMGFGTIESIKSDIFNIGTSDGKTSKNLKSA
jgi:hypothetical protein